jgi:hypothetical protein
MYEIIVNIGDAFLASNYLMFFYEQLATGLCGYHEIESIEKIGSVCDAVLEFKNKNVFVAQQWRATIFIHREIKSGLDYRSSTLYHNILISEIFAKKLNLDFVRIFYFDFTDLNDTNNDIYRKTLDDISSQGFAVNSSEFPDNTFLSKCDSDLDLSATNANAYIKPIPDFYNEIISMARTSLALPTSTMIISNSDLMKQIFKIYSGEEFKVLYELRFEIDKNDMADITEKTLNVIEFSQQNIDYNINKNDYFQLFNTMRLNMAETAAKFEEYDYRLKRKKADIEKRIETFEIKPIDVLQDREMNLANQFATEVNAFLNRIAPFTGKLKKLKSESEWNKAYEAILEYIKQIDSEIDIFAQRESDKFFCDTPITEENVDLAKADDLLIDLDDQINRTVCEFSENNIVSKCNNVDLNDELASEYFIEQTNIVVKYLFACYKSCRLISFIALLVGVVAFAFSLPYLATQVYVLTNLTGISVAASYTSLVLFLLAGGFVFVKIKFAKRIKKTLRICAEFLILYFRNYIVRANAFENMLNCCCKLEKLHDKKTKIKNLSDEDKVMKRKMRWHHKKIVEHLNGLDYFEDLIKMMDSSEKQLGQNNIEIDIDYDKNVIDNEIYSLTL